MPSAGAHRAGRIVSATALSVQNLHVVRGKKPVLQDVSATVPTGAVVGLLGPSGSGKTTLLRACVGVQRISSGSITVLGLPAGTASLRETVGYVTQAASVYKDLTVEENVRYFAAMHGRSRIEATTAISDVGLSKLAKRTAQSLSGGQFSRVSLACALVAAPRLLMLDEPTVGLDPVLRADLWAQFAQLSTNGTTLVVSSHVMEEASHCDSLLLLRAGRLLAALTPGQLRERGQSEDLELAFLHLIQSTDVEFTDSAQDGAA